MVCSGWTPFIAVQDRVAKLQELYMRDSDQSKALTVHDSIQQSNLLQLATPEMLAVSKPPASFPVPRAAKASCIVPALHEIETLQRERVSLKEQVGQGFPYASSMHGCALSHRFVYYVSSQYRECV